MITKVLSIFNFFSVVSEAREMERKFYLNRPDLRHLYRGY